MVRIANGVRPSGGARRCENSLTDTRSPERTKFDQLGRALLAGPMKPKVSIEPVVSIVVAMLKGFAERPIAFDATSAKSCTVPAGAPAAAERAVTLTPRTWTS